MTTATAPRLPQTILSVGQVAVRPPLEAGAIAHRFAFAYREIPGRLETFKELVYLAACAPEDDPCAGFSAGWADHHGAVACTEPACFPDA